MPNLTTPFLNLKGEDTGEDLKAIQEWSTALIDELKYILCNLDAGNVTEAGSVTASNIDCTKARIKGAQIQSLTADKISAGTIDAGEVTIASEDVHGTMKLDGESLQMYDGNGKLRIAFGQDEDGNYIFTVQNADETQGVYMDETGEVYMTGTLNAKDGIISGKAVNIGEVAEPAINFSEASGTTKASIYLKDGAVYIEAEGLIFINTSTTDRKETVIA